MRDDQALWMGAGMRLDEVRKLPGDLAAGDVEDQVATLEGGHVHPGNADAGRALRDEGHREELLIRGVQVLVVGDEMLGVLLDHLFEGVVDAALDP